MSDTGRNPVGYYTVLLPENPVPSYRVSGICANRFLNKSGEEKKASL
jgi:hypothetical protein